jgi:hypothetical protein
MSILKSLNRLHGHPRAGRRVQCSKPFRRVALEPLEDWALLAVPAIVFHEKGAAGEVDSGTKTVIKNVAVELVFWGKGWEANQNAKTLHDKLEQGVKSILDGPYTSGLAQYGGVGKGNWADSVSINSTSPGSKFDEAGVVGMLQANMKAKTLPDPSTNDQLLYIVVAPPGSTGTDPVFGDYGGVHRFNAFGQTRFHYAALSNPKSLTPQNLQQHLDYLTLLFSHVLVEAVTDPDLDSYQLKPRSASNELSDKNAQFYAYRLGGSVVQSYWSGDHQAFIVPTGLTQTFFVEASRKDGKPVRTLAVKGDQLDQKNDTVALDVSAAGGVIATLNRETAQFDPCVIDYNGFKGDPCRVSGVTIETLTGDDTITIVGTKAGTPTAVRTGPGTNTVNIGDPANGSLDKIPGGTLNINKQDPAKGKLLLTYNDHAYNGTEASGPYTLNSSGSVTRPKLSGYTVANADTVTLNVGGRDQTVELWRGNDQRQGGREYRRCEGYRCYRQAGSFRDQDGAGERHADRQFQLLHRLHGGESRHRHPPHWRSEQQELYADCPERGQDRQGHPRRLGHDRRQRFQRRKGESGAEARSGGAHRHRRLHANIGRRPQHQGSGEGGGQVRSARGKSRGRRWRREARRGAERGGR